MEKAGVQRMSRREAANRRRPERWPHSLFQGLENGTEVEFRPKVDVLGPKSG